MSDPAIVDLGSTRKPHVLQLGSYTTQPSHHVKADSVTSLAHGRDDSVSSSQPLIEKSRMPTESDYAEEERERRRPPEWLAGGTFFDLAWTVTFSSLTSNTPISTPSTIASYGVFFTLCWWLWAGQVAYDTKYFTNDWFHRLMLLAQLAVFGSMAAFTKDFDPFSKNVNPKAGNIEDFQTEQYHRTAHLGISGLFAASRVLLAIAYIRVLFYARKSRGMKGYYRPIYTQIATCLAAAALYGLAAIVVKVDLTFRSVVLRIALWFLAQIVEVGSFLFTPDVPLNLLVNNRAPEMMSQRVATLTTIILGEGVNNVASVLVLAASAIGFGLYPSGSTAATSVIIAFSFLLYFDGWRPMAQHRRRSRVEFLLHFPLHVALVILMESLKNLLTLTSLCSTLWDFDYRQNHPTKGESNWNAMEAAYKHIGIALNKTLGVSASGVSIAASLAQYMSNDTAALSSPDVASNSIRGLDRVLTLAYQNILQQYQLPLSDDVSQNFTAYLSNINTAEPNLLIFDTSSGNYVPQALTISVLNDQARSIMWIPVAAGVFLATMPLFALINSWIPKRALYLATSAGN
ncbi:hypothetical protein EXIGLDRAFT_695329 [Exidia glandulosa HHB12029]|uniref:Uncharacterized protein n=1 Tax=Exidia glandulosa HHB12029 TaxID=1314781 RepID=A0A165FZY5_EXIGL|nr:hypothetical protein EXIGLDRAFT_695329 [Exidia glandulosa HHB12029]